MFNYRGSGWINAGIAQLAERKLPKLEVASSTLVARSSNGYRFLKEIPLSRSGNVIPGVHFVQTGN